MNDILLIKKGSNLMKRLTAINGSVDIDKLIPSIWTSQITDIKRILTNDLYNKILIDYENDTLSGVYKTIYDDYVSTMLVFYATSDFIMKNSIIIGNGGNFKHKPENGEIVDYKEIDRQVKYYREMGAHFELEFYEYMKVQNVPEYSRKCNETTNTFKFPWYL